MAFDILMQYYSKLSDQISFVDDDKLCAWFADTGIITCDDMEFIKTQHMMNKAEVTLTRLASHLLLGGTTSFYKMLEILQNHGVINDDLVAEIQQKLPIGM